MSKTDIKKCKKCGYRMTKLYWHRNNKGKHQWIPIVWYCKDCDKISDRIRQ